MTKEKEIIKILENTKIKKETKEKVKTIMKKIHKENLEEMFGGLKNILEENNED